MLKHRPENFRLKYDHSLAKGLVFAGLGGGRGSVRYLDSSSYANHGTLTAMDPPTDWVWVPELGRWAIDYDGTNDYIGTGKKYLPGTGLFADSGEAFTVAVWAYFDGDGTLIARAGPTAALRQFQLFRISGNLTTLYRGTQRTLAAAATSTWMHVATSWNGVAAAAYLNGELTGTQPEVGANVEEDQTITFGARSSGAGYFLDGRLADTCILNRALSQNELRGLADPSNVMLSGLILPPKRKYFGFYSSIPAITQKRFFTIKGIGVSYNS